MSPAEITLVVLVGLGIIGGILSWLARRLDALHKRVVNSLAVLDAQLVRRADLSMDLASSGALDDASEVIVAQAAWEAGIQGERLVGEDPSREAPSLGKLAEMTTSRGVDRSVAENHLTVALRAALGDADDIAAIASHPEGKQILDDLQATCYRVQLARRFHNDAVESVLKLRRSWIVRSARLAGRAAVPYTFEMDDDVFVGSTTT